MFDGMSDTAQKDKLMTELKGHEVSMPFRFRSPDNGKVRVKWWDGEERNGERPYDGLNTVLGASTFYRYSDYMIYYDPTGSEYKYTWVEGGDRDHAGKLFVIHLGDNRFTRCYYFDTSYGFRDQN